MAALPPPDRTPWDACALLTLAAAVTLLAIPCLVAGGLRADGGEVDVARARAAALLALAEPSPTPAADPDALLAPPAAIARGRAEGRPVFVWVNLPPAPAVRAAFGGAIHAAAAHWLGDPTPRLVVPSTGGDWIWPAAELAGGAVPLIDAAIHAAPAPWLTPARR